MECKQTALLKDIDYSVSLNNNEFSFFTSKGGGSALPEYVLQRCSKILEIIKNDFYTFGNDYIEYYRGGEKSIRLGAIYNAIPLTDDNKYFLDIKTENTRLVSLHISSVCDKLYYCG